MKKLKVKLTFTEPLLGTANNNANIHREFIASKAPDAISAEEEVAALGVEGVEEKTMTVFARNAAGEPILWNYQILGFFKEACGGLQRIKEEDCAKESAKLKAYKKIIDTAFIMPMGLDGSREIPIKTECDIDDFQRPLRAQTAQGERITLTNSEKIQPKATCEFYIVSPNKYINAIYEWLDYGEYHGIGQWRNAGHGRFTWELLAAEPYFKPKKKRPNFSDEPEPEEPAEAMTGEA